MDSDLRFQVLGPIRVLRGDKDLTPKAMRQKAILALLLVNAGNVVPPSAFIDMLWPHEPPDHALTILRRQVPALRRTWEPDLPNRSSGRWLLRQSGGYRLAVGDESLDLLRFRRLVAHARADNTRTSLLTYASALSLWRAPAATDLDERSRRHPDIAAVRREHGVAASDFALAAIRHGDPATAVPSLVQASECHPLDEALQARLIRLLTAAGRRAEALDRYERLRHHLADEFGVDPARELQEAYEDVLRRPAVNVSTRPGRPPALVPPLIGREEVLTIVENVLAEKSPHTPAVIAFDGMPGIGKTALAVHLAHRLAGRYPDGRLFLDLHGFDEADAVTADESLYDLLSGLGATDRMPAGRQARAGLYRTLLRDRRVLVVLDNARDVAQVADLLPPAPGSLTILTSRRRLTELRISAAASLITVGLPPPSEAREHISRRRVAGDLAALDAIVDYYGRLPLALATVAANAAGRTGLAPHDIVGEFDEVVRHRLAAAFDSSYRLLSERAAGLFRMLPSQPGDEFTTAELAELTGLSRHAARTAADELCQAGLMHESLPGVYGWHKLVRAYATGLS